MLLRGVRDFVMKDRSALWVVVRRPLALLFVCGCVVSMWASGRLSVRLIADGMVSFAFLPAFQLLAFAIVYRRTPRPLPVAEAADRFFAGNTPWLWWLVAFATLRCLLSPVQAGAPPQSLLAFVKATLAGVLAWSALRRLPVLSRGAAGARRHPGCDPSARDRLDSWPRLFFRHRGLARDRRKDRAVIPRSVPRCSWRRIVAARLPIGRAATRR